MSDPVQSPVFVGRREEIASLTALLERAASGEPGFAIVAGEAGVGKTRLVTELAGHAADSGITVLAGHCVELGAEGLLLAPLIDALRTLAGDRQEAGRGIRQAYALASGIGAAPIADEATALARRTRLSLDEPDADAGRPAPEDPLARFGLTEREREILVLLAAGRSNPQIAGALFISPKTASVHVSNILGKLGVDSRVEAAAVAHRLGVTG